MRCFRLHAFGFLIYLVLALLKVAPVNFTLNEYMIWYINLLQKNGIVRFKLAIFWLTAANFSLEITGVQTSILTTNPQGGICSLKFGNFERKIFRRAKIRGLSRCHCFSHLQQFVRQSDITSDDKKLSHHSEVVSSIQQRRQKMMITMRWRMQPESGTVMKITNACETNICQSTTSHNGHGRNSHS